MGLDDLATARRRTLERLFCAGAMPDVSSLVGWEYRGFVPWLPARVLRLQRFVKGMFGGAGGPEGYNVICSQRDWSRRRVRGKPLRHGWYTVRAASGRRSGCVELDYSASPRNAKLNPERLLRHFVVQPDPANPDLLLGKAYVKVGALVPVAFFVLERDRRIA